MRPTTVLPTVRLTARVSGIFFAAAQAASAWHPRAGRVARRLYWAFMAAHALHFAAVARYAVVTGGKRLFPGERDLDEVGGWPTVLGIYTGFAALALTGTRALPADPGRPRRSSIAGWVATGLVAAMYVGTYLGQVPRSPWAAAPAGVIATATAAHLWAVSEFHSSAAVARRP